MASLQTEVLRIVDRAALDPSSRSIADRAVRHWREGDRAADIGILRDNNTDPLVVALTAVITAGTGGARGEVLRVVRTLQAHPIDADTWTLIAAACWICGSLQEAIEACDRAVTTGTARAWPWMIRGSALVGLNRSDEGLRSLRRAADLDPTDGWIKAEQAEALRCLGDLPSAEVASRIAVELAPDSSFTLVELGAILTLSRQLGEAVGVLTRAIDLDPAKAWAWAWRAEAWKMSGKLYLSIVDLERALQIEPNYHWALLMLGEALYGLGCYVDALAALERALEIKKADWWACSLSGYANTALGRHEEAARAFHEASRLGGLCTTPVGVPPAARPIVP